MASKLQEYRRMSEEAQRQLTGSLERWQSFLATASRLYKYPYHEQVMIHAQRPDATACAEFDVWNNTMRRYVRRGSKGIALIDTSGDRERLRYVFDVSDTGTRPNSRSLNLWELREEHIPAVSSMLEKNYGVPAGENLAVQLEAVASQLAREYWEDNRRDILGILEDSFLEEYDEFNVGVAFRNAAEVSISYSLIASLNHYSKGAACEWLFKTMCGIRVDGENHFTISPRPGGHFTYAKAGYQSVYGRVESGWTRERGKTLFEITVPANCTAELCLPGQEPCRLTAVAWRFER